MISKKDEVQAGFIDTLSKKFWGIHLISIRAGKCRISLKSIQKHSENYIKDPKILILSPFLDIMKSWLIECNLIDYHPEIVYCTFKSIETISNLNWDYIIVDEGHAIGEENQLPILGELIKRHANTIIISGTYNSETLESLKEFTNMDLVINYSTEDAIEDGIIADFKVIIYEYSLDNTTLVTFGKKKQWKSTELKECNRLSKKVDTTYGQEKMFHALNRMRFINSCNSLTFNVNRWITNNPLTRFILFTGDENVGKRYNLPMYNSKSKSDDVLIHFQQETINQLCLIKKGKQGITYPNLQHILITAIDSNSENLEQAIGRSLLDDTDDATIHIFVSNQEFQQKWLNKAISGINPDKITYKTIQ